MRRLFERGQKLFTTEENELLDDLFCAIVKASPFVGGEFCFECVNEEMLHKFRSRCSTGCATSRAERLEGLSPGASDEAGAGDCRERGRVLAGGECRETEQDCPDCNVAVWLFEANIQR